MSDFLRVMADRSEQRAASIRNAFSASDFDHPVCPLTLRGFDLVAEIKMRSPSEGQLSREHAGNAERALQYAEGGAAAISVLTEPSRFGGHMSHLRDVVAAVKSRRIPVMRKDFLVDGRQVLEARAAGASGVLLIAAMLQDTQLQRMLDCAFEHSLFVLLESFDADDVERTRRLLELPQYADKAAQRQLLVGVNSRNLRTLEVDPDRLAKLSHSLPEGAVAVAESGLNDAGDAASVSALGYRVALVGTALMRAPDPAALIGEMLAAGRAAGTSLQGNSKTA
ncbi:MAG TPA: indole-3-glycerol-phosphate synthase [Woeseiaceae bacterium]|nr:indole-3-glycerol-phosphate synthase [Woeseiaceae bacterium]